MTRDRDIERILGQWLGGGPTEVPDRVIDVVADRISRQSQRPAWRLNLTRPNVTKTILAVAAVEAVVIVALVGYTLIAGGPRSGVGGPSATPSINPTASPDLTSGPSGPPSPAAGRRTSVNFHPTLQFELPTGWVILDDQDRGFVFLNDTAPTDATIGLTMGPVLTSNDQDCAGLPTAGVEATVDGMVRALRKDTRLAVTAARPVTVAGYSGQTLDIQLARTWVGTCPWSGLAPAALVLTVPDPPCCMFGLVGSERTRLILLDAGGSVLTIGIDSGDGSNFDRLTAQARLIIDSFEFTP